MAVNARMFFTAAATDVAANLAAASTGTFATSAAAANLAVAAPWFFGSVIMLRAVCFSHTKSLTLEIEDDVSVKHPRHAKNDLIPAVLSEGVAPDAGKE